MNTQQQCLAVALTALIAPCAAIAAHAAPSYPIAGLTPYQRPANAPVLTTNPARDAGQALHGVSTPIPDSLKFLNDQGGWFTPFTRPGMTGSYDLRRWHAAPTPAAEKK
jgi:hypothetical protein